VLVEIGLRPERAHELMILKNIRKCDKMSNKKIFDEIK
jgi:hypothetical protein